jgi:hypothetical protein
MILRKSNHDDLALCVSRTGGKSLSSTVSGNCHEAVLHDPEVSIQEPPVKDDLLLAQLKRLAELRDRGLLSEQEFMIEKKKLTR